MAIIAAAEPADMANCPIETQILLNFCQALNNSELNNGITQHIFEELRRVLNKDEIEITDIVQVIDSMVSNDHCSRQNTRNRFNLNRVKDEARGAGGTEGYKQDKVDKRRPCFVGRGKHNYRMHDCKYTCRHCGKRGNHWSEDCLSKDDRKRKAGIAMSGDNLHLGLA